MTSALSRRSSVLIVDDDAVSRQLLQSALLIENYEVIVAKNGDAALTLAAQHRPDVVLLDVVMPGRNGYEVCRQLRADPALQQLHILLLTGLAGRESRLAGLEAGADDFLNKPIDLVELRTRLRTITSLKRFRQLSHERARFEAAVAHSPDGIVLADENAGVLHANASFLRIVGNRSGAVFAFLPAETAARFREQVAGLEEGKAFGPIETPLTGTPREVTAEVTMVRLPSGGSVMLQFIIRDITERKQLEAQFLRSQRIELLGQLAGGIVHDVNNILTAITGYAGMLECSDNGEAASHARIIQHSAHRGGVLLRGILAFARGNDCTLSPTEVAAVVQDTLPMVKQLMGRRIAIEIKVQDGLSPILADANQLHQVVLNLCVNSRDAMPDGGKLTLTLSQVHVSSEEASRIGADAVEGNFVALSVRDTGTGIAPELISRLFDPFFTTKPPEVGTGLGLATVLRLIRGHRGFVGVESEVGVGTCFTCYFPVPSANLVALESPELPAAALTAAM